MVTKVVLKNGRFVKEEDANKPSKTINAPTKVVLQNGRFVKEEQPKAAMPSIPNSKPIGPTAAPNQFPTYPGNTKSQQDQTYNELMAYKPKANVPWWDSNKGLAENLKNVAYKTFVENQDERYSKDKKLQQLKKNYQDARKQVEQENVKNYKPDLADKISMPFFAGAESSRRGLESTVAKLTGQQATQTDPTFTEQIAAKIGQNEKNKFAKGYQDVTQSIGAMVPSMLTGNPTAALAVGFGSYGGNAYNQAKNEGKTEEQAIKYGIATGTLEMGMQKVLGGLSSVYGKSFVSDATSKVMGKLIKNEAIKHTLSSMGDEFTEEYLQEILSPVVRNLTLDEHNKFKPITKDALYSGLLGGITAGLLEGPVNLAANKQTIAPVKQDISKNPFVISKNSEKQTESPQIQAKPLEQVQLVQEQQETPRMAANVPNVVYHGTPNTFENFDIARSGENNSKGHEKGIVWFTPNKDIAEGYSYEKLPTDSNFIEKQGKKGNVYERKIDMKNPLDLTNLTLKDAENIVKTSDEQLYTPEQILQMSKAPNGQLLKAEINAPALKALGYDGIIARHDKDNLEYGVFDSSQISKADQQENDLVSSAKQYFDFNKPQTVELIDTLSKVAAQRNLNIVFDDNVAGNGQIQIENGQRTIKLNPNSNRAVEFTFMHELTHDLEGTPEYKELQDLVLNFNNGKESYEAAKASLEKTYHDFYNKHGLDPHNVNIDSEVTADILGQILGDQNYINTLSVEKPNLFQRIMNWINKQIELFRSSNRKETKFLQDVKSKFEAAYRQEAVQKTDSKHSIDDFGEKIGGARKDIMKGNKITDESIANMNEREIKSLVKKDKVIPKIDYKALVEGGVPPEVALFIKQVRDAIPTTPTFSKDISLEETSKGYIEALNDINDRLNFVRTKEDVLNFKSKFIVQGGYLEKGNYSYQLSQKGKISGAITNKLLKAMGVSEWDYGRLEREAKKTGFGTDNQLKGYEVHQDRKTGEYYVTKGRYIIEDHFKTEQAAIDFAKSIKTTKTTGKTKLEPKQLEHIERVGFDYRNGKDITGEDYLDVFNFKGGEFGNWQNQNDRQTSLNYGYDALLDLANVLGITPESISLGGELSIAFGARGTAGAKAHYERMRKVINLTKMKGAGSLGHEWLHALDDYLSKMANIKGAEDNLLSEIKAYHIEKSSLPEEVAQKFNKLLEVIKRKEKVLTTEEINERKKQSNSRHINNIDYYVSNYKKVDGTAQFIESIKQGDVEAVEQLSKYLKEKTGRVLPKETRDSLGMYARFIAHSSEDSIPKKIMVDTDYFKAAVYLDNQTTGAKSGHNYWQSNPELLARAFSTYLQDNLGIRSDYLESGHINALYSFFDENAKPFLEGEERIRVNEAMRDLFEALKKHNLLQASNEKIDIANNAVNTISNDTGEFMEGKPTLEKIEEVEQEQAEIKAAQEENKPYLLPAPEKIVLLPMPKEQPIAPKKNEKLFLNAPEKQLLLSNDYDYKMLPGVQKVEEQQKTQRKPRTAKEEVVDDTPIILGYLWQEYLNKEYNLTKKTTNLADIKLPAKQVAPVKQEQKQVEVKQVEPIKKVKAQPNLTEAEQLELDHLLELEQTPFMDDSEVARLKELQDKIKGITPLIKEMHARQTEKEIEHKTKDLQNVLFIDTKEDKAQLKQVLTNLANSKLTGEALKSEITKQLQNNFQEKTIKYADEELKIVKKAIRSIRIKITDELKLNVTDFEKVRKSNFGKVTFAKDGKGVDQLYETLSEQYPYIFDQDTINPYDRLDRIIEVANQDVITEERYSLDDQVIDEAAESIYSYLSNKETIESLAKKKNPLIEKMIKEAVAPVKENKLVAAVQGFAISETPLLPTRHLTTKVLDEKPVKETQILSQMKSDKMTIGESFDILTQKLVNRGHFVDKIAKEENKPELTHNYDAILSVSAEGQFEVEKGQTDNKNNIIGKSINEIFKPVEDAGLLKEFTQYMLHKLNIDRAKRKKNVFGDDFNSEQSKAISDSLEQKYPQFKEWAKPVYKFYENNLQNMVDAGLVSESLQEHLGNLYGNYVKILRDKQKTLSSVPFKNARANNPLKEAVFSNANILPLKDAMAHLAIKTKQAVRTNELALALFDNLEGIKDLEEYKQVKGDIDNPVKLEGSHATLSVFKDGEAYSMPISEELYESLKPITKNKVENTILFRGIQKVSSTQRDLLTVKNPIFLAVNFFKDAQDGIFNSKYPLKFAPNYVRAVKEIATNGPHYMKYMASGGESNTYFDYEKGVKKAPGKLGKFVEKIMTLNEAVEKAPRLAEFISTIEDGKSLKEAMYNAAEVTTNFKRGGEWTKFANRNGANFLNASVQGFSKFQRNITGQNGFRGYTNVLYKATILGVLPSVLNHLLLGDDDDYKNLPDYVKDTYFLFKTGDNDFIRIPKGRVLSVFGMAARRTIEYASGEKDAYKGLGQAIVNQIAPNNPQTSNIATPLYDALNNKTWFGGNLVSKRLQNELPKNQWDETTDEVSKFLGEKLNLSPKKINYLLQQYSGGIGDVLLPSITPEAHKNAVSDKFTINSEMKNKNVSDFFEAVDNQTQIANDPGATDEDILKSKYLNSKRASTNLLYKQKRAIQLSKMSNEKKNIEVNKIQVKINKIAEEALKEYNKVKMISNDHAQVGDIEYYLKSKGWTKARY